MTQSPRSDGTCEHGTCPAMCGECNRPCGCVDRSRAELLLLEVADWDLDKPGGCAHARDAIERAFAEVRREAVEACARRVFETPEHEVPGTIAGIIEWLSAHRQGAGRRET